MAVLLPNGKQQFFTTPGVPAVGYKLATFAAGTSSNQTTWVDALKVGANTNPIILDARGEAVIFWEGAYKVQLQDATGAPIWTVDNVQSQPAPSASLIPSVDNSFTLGSPSFSWANVYVGANHAPVLDTVSGNIGYYARTAIEIAAAVTPTNYAYPFGDLRRYGAIGGPAGTIPAADDSAAWAKAVSVAYAVIPQGMAFKIVTGASFTGQITVLGFGQTSQLYCDAAILTNTAGTGSVVDNFYLGNITPPYVITRNPSNWATVINAATQSSTVLGYQPTGNDPEYAALVATYPSIATQNIGPTVTFTGNASGIKVSRIFGNFVRINIMDAINSTVQDCVIRGGKGSAGAITFDNITNAAQVGSNNRAINNVVTYASNSGINFLANYDFVMRGNSCALCGESGVKTSQAFGALFTGSVGGLTAGTLQSATTNGVWTFLFANAETRSVTVTGGTACAWAGALAAGSILTASFYSGPAPFTLGNAQCFRGQIVDNKCYENFYDGVDASSSFGPNDNAATYHQVSNNHIWNNGGTGMNIDGKFNAVVGNHVFQNYKIGIWGSGVSFSNISKNVLIDNNTQRNISNHDLVVTGTNSYNVIDGNYVWGGPTQNNDGIYAPTTNYIRNNSGYNSVFFYGLPGAITSVLENNTDAASGLQTDQSFALILQNTAGTLQHQIIEDVGAGALGNFSSRIIGGTATLTNTPNGADASTPFANGGKISSVNTNWFILNTAPQNEAFSQLQATITGNKTGTALNVQCFAFLENVNGVTQLRIILQFTNAATDASFALTTANITAGNYIKIQFIGKIA